MVLTVQLFKGHFFESLAQNFARRFACRLDWRFDCTGCFLAEAPGSIEWAFVF